MNFFSHINWVWPAILLAFSLGVVITKWWYSKRSNNDNQVNKEYFKGLNFLLNEEPDKAIEVFIKALEVDSETVELHLALGGLFRRKGQVDRATRIHQNLIARPSLTDEQRMQSVYELAQDYYKAGLLDRAENLFLELKDSALYRHQAIDGLSEIYQQEKEWPSAISVLNLHKRAIKPKYAKQLSHFWCEMAEQAIKNKEYDAARKYLRSAVSENRLAVSSLLLRGELAFQQQDFEKAISVWRSSIIENSSLSELVVHKLIESYQSVDDKKGLSEYLSVNVALPKSTEAFIKWSETLIELFGKEQAVKQMIEKVGVHGLSGPVAHFLNNLAREKQLDVYNENELLIILLKRAQSKKYEYTCIGCGFDTKAIYWHCPNCGAWESFI